MPKGYKQDVLPEPKGRLVDSSSSDSPCCISPVLVAKMSSGKSSTEYSVEPKVVVPEAGSQAIPVKGRLRGNGDAFALGASGEFYEPIPEYEGLHRFDPTAEWTAAEEKKLVRKVCLSRSGASSLTIGMLT